MAIFLIRTVKRVNRFIIIIIISNIGPVCKFLNECQ